MLKQERCELLDGAPGGLVVLAALGDDLETRELGSELAMRIAHDRQPAAGQWPIRAECGHDEPAVGGERPHQRGPVVIALIGLGVFVIAAASYAAGLSSRRLARYQRKWLRRLPAAATLDAARPPEENALEVIALAGAGERLPRR